MQTIKAYDLYKGKFNEWDLPSKDEQALNSSLTWGTNYDRIERSKVEGGIPMAMKKIN